MTRNQIPPSLPNNLPAHHCLTVTHHEHFVILPIFVVQVLLSAQLPRPAQPPRFCRLATSRFLSNFFELHRAPTYSPTEKLFLKEDTVPSDKHFALFLVVEVVTQGFPRISHENTLIRLGRKLV